MKRFHLLLLLAFLAGCRGNVGVHASELLTTGGNVKVVPPSARTKDGRPFSGMAHGTFFGERSMDCVEWVGPYANGVPDGEFLIYASCRGEPQRVLYRHGVPAVAPNNSFKPKPLRGSA